MLIRFDSLGDYARRCERIDTRHWNTEPTRWYNNLTHGQAIQLALTGDEAVVSQAEAILEQLDAAIETPHQTWTASVYGAYPIVPEFLAGAPDPMRRLGPTDSDTSPVTVYVSTTCSASLDAETMLKRGIAILALVLKLQSMRPVKLCLLAETHLNLDWDGELLQAIEINSQPFDLATVCYALTNVGFARNLTYNMAADMGGWSGGWPSEYHGGGARWEARIRPILDMQPQDLYIGAARSWDQSISDPIGWVNGHIARMRGEAL